MSNIAIVIAFLEAWEKLDADSVNAALRMMSPDIVYKNTGYPDAIGHEQVRKALAPLFANASALTTVIHQVAENADGVVLTERTDAIHYASGTISFPVMGAFDVQSGLITGWRDYFDASPFKSKT